MEQKQYRYGTIRYSSGGMIGIVTGMIGIFDIIYYAHTNSQFTMILATE